MVFDYRYGLSAYRDSFGKKMLIAGEDMNGLAYISGRPDNFILIYCTEYSQVMYRKRTPNGDVSSSYSPPKRRWTDDPKEYFQTHLKNDMPLHVHQNILPEEGFEILKNFSQVINEIGDLNPAISRKLQQKIHDCFSDMSLFYHGP